MDTNESTTISDRYRRLEILMDTDRSPEMTRTTAQAVSGVLGRLGYLRNIHNGDISCRKNRDGTVLVTSSCIPARTLCGHLSKRGYRCELGTYTFVVYGRSLRVSGT